MLKSDMDKLLQLGEKLRTAIVPEKPVSKMSKSELLEFIEEKSIIDRMKIYYGKQEGKKLKSKIHEAVEKEESMVPELADFRNMRVSKIRKVIKNLAQGYPDHVEIKQTQCAQTAKLGYASHVGGEVVPR